MQVPSPAPPCLPRGETQPTGTAPSRVGTGDSCPIPGRGAPHAHPQTSKPLIPSTADPRPPGLVRTQWTAESPFLRAWFGRYQTKCETRSPSSPLSSQPPAATWKGFPGSFQMPVGSEGTEGSGGEHGGINWHPPCPVSCMSFVVVSAAGAQPMEPRPGAHGAADLRIPAGVGAGCREDGAARWSAPSASICVPRWLQDASGRPQGRGGCMFLEAYQGRQVLGWGLGPQRLWCDLPAEAWRPGPAPPTAQTWTVLGRWRAWEQGQRRPGLPAMGCWNEAAAEQGLGEAQPFPAPPQPLSQWPRPRPCSFLVGTRKDRALGWAWGQTHVSWEGTPEPSKQALSRAARPGTSPLMNKQPGTQPPRSPQ